MDGEAKRRAGAGQFDWRRQMRRLVAVATVALGCGACNAITANGPGPVLAAAPGDAPVVAFESIDGPPKAIYGKLVSNLSEEANARQVAVVSRGVPAHYRVRIYAATAVSGKRSVLYWVWDVYNANHQRAFRIAGEEPLKGTRRASWDAADDQLIHKIARTGMERLAGYLHARKADPGRPPAPPVAPAPAGPAIAMASDPSSDH